MLTLRLYFCIYVKTNKYFNVEHRRTLFMFIKIYKSILCQFVFTRLYKRKQ